MLKLRAAVVARPNLAQTLETRAGIKAQLEALERQLEDLDGEILAQARAQGGFWEDEAWRVVAVTGKSADRLQRERLLAQGVSLKVLANATVPGTPYEYPRVTAKRKK